MPSWSVRQFLPLATSLLLIVPCAQTVRTSSLTAISTRCVLHACSRDAPTDPQLPQVFRLAPLLYLEMLLELPPASYPILLLVRKMLSLVRRLSMSTKMQSDDDTLTMIRFLRRSPSSASRYPACAACTGRSSSSVAHLVPIHARS
jgi:hypothetical protein